MTTGRINQVTTVSANVMPKPHIRTTIEQPVTRHQLQNSRSVIWMADGMKGRLMINCRAPVFENRYQTISHVSNCHVYPFLGKAKVNRKTISFDCLQCKFPMAKPAILVAQPSAYLQSVWWSTRSQRLFVHLRNHFSVLNLVMRTDCDFHADLRGKW